MLTHLYFPNQGRLANQFFQIASCIGLSKRYGVGLRLPKWEYAKYFEAEFPVGKVENAKHVQEPGFTFAGEFWDIQDWSKDIAVSGYLQSPKFWEGYEKEVRQQFKFKPELISTCREPFAKAFEKTTIAIHVRRGDYTNNPNYVNLPPAYYIIALESNFPDWRNCNLIFFSDDPDYCKKHYQCLPNAFFSDNFIDIADLCLMSQCDHFIIANSSFSFWGAYLAEKKGTKIVYPVRHFSGKLKDHSTRDLYPSHWTPFDHFEQKIPLKEITFTIPVSFDHQDRKENLELCLAYLISHFDTNIVIGEQGGRHFEYLSQYCDYRHFELDVFHRTKMLNDMASEAKTPFVANYDCDVFFSPMAISEAVERLKKGAEMVYPYGGDFLHVERSEGYHKLADSLDIGMLDTRTRATKNSKGGAVFTNKKAYFKAGGENENMVNHGPEDAERFERCTKLGVKIERVGGYAFHIEHWRGVNSHTEGHKHSVQNRKEFEAVKSMSRNELEKHISVWNWLER